MYYIIMSNNFVYIKKASTDKNIYYYLSSIFK